MTNMQQRMFLSFFKVRAFMHQYDRKKPQLSRLRHKFDDVMTRIDALRETHVFTATGLGSNGIEIRALRDTLRYDHLIPIARHGRSLLKSTPGIERALKIPHARADSKTVVEAAIRIGKAVQPHKKLFIEDGFSKTFFAEMMAASNALRVRYKRANAVRHTRTEVTGALAEEFRHGRELVRMIDGVIIGPLRHDRVLVDVWKTARRVPATIGRPRTPRPRKKLAVA